MGLIRQYASSASQPPDLCFIHFLEQTCSAILTLLVLTFFGWWQRERAYMHIISS